MIERRAPHFIEKIGVMNGTGPRCKLEQKAALGLELINGFFKGSTNITLLLPRYENAAGPRPLYSLT